MTTENIPTIESALRPYGGLANYWHPVEWSSAVDEMPKSIRLLGLQIVLWRNQDGLNAFYDLCVHRGTPLSLGRVSDQGELICAYHGWHYDSTGSCTWIPSREPSKAIPPKARAVRFHCEERYGLVWVCVGSPERDIPTFPSEFETPGFFWRAENDDWWKCNSARFVENMMDTSHFAWVHPGIFGTQDKPIVDPIDILEDRDGLRYECIEPIGHMVEPETTHIRSYEMSFPFMILFRTRQPNRPEREVTWYVCSPADAKNTRFFQFLRRNYEHPMPLQERAALIQTIQSQDRSMVEAQRPEELPLDLREELHLHGPDDVALRYRKMLQKLDIDWS